MQNKINPRSQAIAILQQCCTQVFKELEEGKDGRWLTWCKLRRMPEETPEQKIARYEATLRAIQACTLTGVDYGDWIQAVVDDALEGLWPECWNCGTHVHEGLCVGEGDDEG